MQTEIKSGMVNQGQCDGCGSHINQENGLLQRADSELNRIFPYKRGERRICDACLHEREEEWDGYPEE